MPDTNAWQSPSIGERARGAIWLAPFLVAISELIGHATMSSRVATDEDWAAAGDYVRENLRERDQVISAPEWVDPLVRRELGATLGIDRVGAIDLEGFERVFVLSVRGHRPPLIDLRVPQETRHFGEVAVARHDLGPSPVLYDFVAHLPDARVERVDGEKSIACPLTRVAPRGGGLGQGAYWPAERFVCDPQRPWLFVAKTVNEDRDLALRTCIFQHPQGIEPIRTTYTDVPLGERLVLDADIYYENERNEQHGTVPFEIRVLVDGRDMETMRHVDGDGRKRMVVRTGDGSSESSRRGTVSIEVTTADPHLRTVCWSGSTRLSTREERR